MTFGVSVDAFSEGEITSSGGAPQTLRLGPVVTGEWHWRTAPWRFRSLDVSVMDRFRTEFEREGASVAGSDANYLDVAVRGQLPLWRRTDLVVGVDARHQTGMDSDATIAAAAYAGGGLTLGVARELGSGFQLQPVVRVQFGRLESQGVSTNVTGFGGGVSVARRF
jgi:hypothetical protein